MTRDELSQYDGRDGRAAYVAVSGTIYDVSESTYWRDGSHEDQHQAGHDLTEKLRSAPHVRTVVERFPVVDRLTEPAAAPKSGLSPLSIVIIGVVVVLLIVTYLVAL